MEVAAISRNLSRALQLNEDLCETIALAHDLGHSPFGHKGEVVLNLYRHGRAWLDGAASAFPDDDNLKNIP
jgi:dGTPase